MSMLTMSQSEFVSMQIFMHLAQSTNQSNEIL